MSTPKVMSSNTCFPLSFGLSPPEEFAHFPGDLRQSFSSKQSYRQLVVYACSGGWTTFCEHGLDSLMCQEVLTI